MSDNKKEFEISLPGEWAIKKLLGPTIDEVGNDLKNVYAVGRDKIIEKAIRKTKNINDDRKANLRISRDIFWNGAYTDEEICAEYFGGILTSSRSDDGKNDDSIYYLEMTKSMSSKQLHLHYIIYNSLNKLFKCNKNNVNLGLHTDLAKNVMWFDSLELLYDLNLPIKTDFNVLLKLGLIEHWMMKADEDSKKYLTEVGPTTLGIILYAIAQNEFENWEDFNKREFGDFPNIQCPSKYSLSKDDFLGENQ